MGSPNGKAIDANYLYTQLKIFNNEILETRYLDKTSTKNNEVAGAIYVGNYTSDIENAYLHMRKVTSANTVTGKLVNGACFSVNSDGVASFQHNIYDDYGKNVRNAAILRFYGTAEKTGKIQFAINTGSSISPTEDMYKDVAMVEDIDKVSVSAEGTSTTEVSYIKINDNEYKIAGDAVPALIDDVTGKKYRLGVSNGQLYIVEQEVEP